MEYEYGPVNDVETMDVNISIDKLVKCRIRYIDYDGSIINEKEISDNSSIMKFKLILKEKTMSLMVGETIKMKKYIHQSR